MIFFRTNLEEIIKRTEMNFPSKEDSEPCLQTALGEVILLAASDRHFKLHNSYLEQLHQME
jgi:hypothetical protein